MWIWVLNLTLLFIFEVVLIALIIPKEYLLNMVQAERQQILHWFAPERTSQMISDANASFQNLIVDTGLQQGIIDTFYVNAQQLTNNRGIDKFVQSPEASWGNERIESLWIVLHAVFIRWDLFIVCMTLSLLFLIPTLVDGLCNWQKLRSSDDNASINIYNVAEKTLYVLAILPVYGLFAPVPITPQAIIIWALFCAFCIWLMTSNLQHRI